MDNFKMDVHTTGDKSLEMCIELAMVRNSKVVGYAIHEGSMVLFWYEPSTKPAGYSPLPMPFSSKFTTAFVAEWLKSQPIPTNSMWSDDIEIGEAFRVSCDDWGHIQPFGPSAFLRITPSAAWYGK